MAKFLLVLGSNAKDPELKFLLQGTGEGWSSERKVRNFKSPAHLRLSGLHSKFLILALSLSLEVGALEVSYPTYPTTKATIKEDGLVPHDRHVCSFQELIIRCDIDLSFVLLLKPCIVT